MTPLLNLLGFNESDIYTYNNSYKSSDNNKLLNNSILYLNIKNLNIKLGYININNKKKSKINLKLENTIDKIENFDIEFLNSNNDIIEINNYYLEFKIKSVDINQLINI